MMMTLTPVIIIPTQPKRATRSRSSNRRLGTEAAPPRIDWALVTSTTPHTTSKYTMPDAMSRRPSEEGTAR